MSRTSLELNRLSRPAAVHATASSSRHSLVDDALYLDNRSQASQIGILPAQSSPSDADVVSSAVVAPVSKTTTGIVIASVTLITAISTLLNGVTTVALPTIAHELLLPPSLLLWPSSIQALTCGCTLLISGSVADVIGARTMYLLGCILQSAFTLGCGLAQDAAQIILFRGLSGVAISLCLPSAVSIITRTFVGKRRDLAFASMGGGQPIGFSLGLTLGGLLTASIGWRWAFHISAILNTIVLIVAAYGLPRSIDEPVGAGEGDANNRHESTWKAKMARLKTDIDWIGAGLASTSLAMLSYVFAALTGSTREISRPYSIVLLVAATSLIPLFIFWVGRREKLGRPAIIPNSLWRNRAFTAICLCVFLTWGSFNALETMLTFYFQEAQELDAIQTSLRFLPAPVSGALANIIVGIFVHRIAGNYLVIAGCALSAVGPLVMVPARTNSSYWTTGFLANVFNPMGADALFTVANLLVTSVFPSKTQALAGGVFNTVSQIGKAVGLALAAVIANVVTANTTSTDKTNPEALLIGYRATFWFCFASVAATVVVAVWGLRNIGKVGHKQD